MATELLRPGERLDDLLIGGLKIIQNAGLFRFSLDAVLLAHFGAHRPVIVEAVSELHRVERFGETDSVAHVQTRG